MTRFAVDPSTFLQLARDDRRPHADHRLVAPSSLRSRALELVLREVRAGEIDDAEAMRLHDRLTEQKVRLLGDRVSRRTAWGYARQLGWDELDDAEHLAVARLQADVLVTSDTRLAAAASGIVPLAAYDDLFSP